MKTVSYTHLDVYKRQVHKLVEILHRLADGGNTVVVIEHNLDVIKTADYILSLIHIFSGWISMTEPMWYCWEVQQKVQTVWRPRMLTGTRW